LGEETGAGRRAWPVYEVVDAKDGLAEIIAELSCRKLHECHLTLMAGKGEAQTQKLGSRTVADKSI